MCNRPVIECNIEFFENQVLKAVFNGLDFNLKDYLFKIVILTAIEPYLRNIIIM